MDDFVNGVYPQPRDASGKDAVYVGRVRDDLGDPGTDPTEHHPGDPADGIAHRSAYVAYRVAHSRAVEGIAPRHIPEVPRMLRLSGLEPFALAS